MAEPARKPAFSSRDFFSDIMVRSEVSRDIRVQATKKTDGEVGIVHFGTEVSQAERA